MHLIDCDMEPPARTGQTVVLDIDDVQPLPHHPQMVSLEEVVADLDALYNVLWRSRKRKIRTMREEALSAISRTYVSYFNRLNR